MSATPPAAAAAPKVRKKVKRQILDAVAHASVFPCRSVMLMIVLLKDA